MKGWTLDDIDWNRFDPSLVDIETLKVVKAAALVEHNGEAYADYLCSVFADDQEFCRAARLWAVEEVRHGAALRRWAECADPAFAFDAAFKTFTDGFHLPMDSGESVRGSRCGELIARCIVETGTSSWYTAIREATREPVLNEICRLIAADELRHYKLFYSHLRRYLESQQLNRWHRLRIALGRIGETEDDELAFAFYAANGDLGGYDRKRHSRAYMRRAYSYYRPHHIDRVVAMVFKAAGLDPQGRLQKVTSKAAWGVMHARAKRLERIAA